MKNPGEPQAAGEKKKRKPRKRKPELERFTVTVSACAISIGSSGADFNSAQPEIESQTTISIQGTLDRPMMRDVRDVYLSVYEAEGQNKNPGGAIGVSTLWQVVLYLPRNQFGDLRALVLSDRLATIDLWVQGLSRGRGPVRSVTFDTVPLPCEQEEEDG